MNIEIEPTPQPQFDPQAETEEFLGKYPNLIKSLQWKRFRGNDSLNSYMDVDDSLGNILLLLVEGSQAYDPKHESGASFATYMMKLYRKRALYDIQSVAMNKGEIRGKIRQYKRTEEKLWQKLGRTTLTDQEVMNEMNITSEELNAIRDSISVRGTLSFSDLELDEKDENEPLDFLEAFSHQDEKVPDVEDPSILLLRKKFSTLLFLLRPEQREAYMTSTGIEDDIQKSTYETERITGYLSSHVGYLKEKIVEPFLQSPLGKSFFLLLLVADKEKFPEGSLLGDMVRDPLIDTDKLYDQIIRNMNTMHCTSILKGIHKDGNFHEFLEHATKDNPLTIEENYVLVRKIIHNIESKAIDTELKKVVTQRRYNSTLKKLKPHLIEYLLNRQ